MKNMFKNMQNPDMVAMGTAILVFNAITLAYVTFSMGPDSPMVLLGAVFGALAVLVAHDVYIHSRPKEEDE